MNESGFTSQVNSTLRDRDSRVLVWKNNDRLAAGRPDVTYIGANNVFAEYKLVKANRLPSRHKPALSELQRQTMNALARLGQVARVFVAFQLPKREWCIVEYKQQEEWEQSTPLNELTCYKSRADLVDAILLLANGSKGCGEHD